MARFNDFVQSVNVSIWYRFYRKTEDIIVYMGVPGKRMSEEEC